MAPIPGMRRPYRVGCVQRHQAVRPTMAGKDAALERLVGQVAGREGSHIQHRVALTDPTQPPTVRTFVMPTMVAQRNPPLKKTA